MRDDAQYQLELRIPCIFQPADGQVDMYFSVKWAEI
jgi:hypothetical protein